MSLLPRDYQESTYLDALSFLQSASPGDKKLYAGPTGVGKSVIEVLIQSALPQSWIVVPRIEIAWGLMEKGADESRISTALTLRNRLLRNEIQPPSHLIFDESHHHNAETWQQIDLLCGMAPAVGFTATPYRGTPKSTQLFREHWGEPQWIMDYKQAVKRGVISFPEIKTLPLIDDDEIEIVNGEFQVNRITSAIRSQFAYIADYTYSHLFNAYGKVWYRPTIFNTPSSETAWEIANTLNAKGMKAGVITDETRPAARRLAFELCVQSQLALVHINVITEGIDLPLRTMIDLCPVMSPVRFVQTFGRITRPVGHGEEPPLYVCTNRNIMRHAYLFDGCVPRAAIKEADEAFITPSKRMGARVVGLEGLGRFKATEIPFADKTRGVLYCIKSVEDAHIHEYAAILHPLHKDVIWATRTHTKDEHNQISWGNWQHCNPPDDIQGFASISAGTASPAQLKWWQRQASYFGLDGALKPSNRTFQILPIMKDLGLRFNT